MSGTLTVLSCWDPPVTLWRGWQGTSRDPRMASLNVLASQPAGSGCGADGEETALWGPAVTLRLDKRPALSAAYSPASSRNEQSR